RSRVATDPRAKTAPSPTRTPGPIVVLAQIQALSSMTIGLVTRSKVCRDQLWLPVHRYAPCETQQCDPIETWSRLSIQTSSPIQLNGPIARRQGNFTLTCGFITTLRPISAPNARKIETRILDPGSPDSTKRRLHRYHNASTIRFRPRSNPLLSNQ